MTYSAPENNDSHERSIADLVAAAAAEFEHLRDQAIADHIRETPQQRVAVVHPEQGDDRDASRPMDTMVADWFSSRRGVKVLGEIQSTEPDDDPDAEARHYVFSRDSNLSLAESIHDVLGQVRRLNNVHVSTKDMTHFSLFLTYWQFARNWDSPDVAFTYRRAAKDLGIAYSGKFAKAMRESVRRLAAWTGEITEAGPDGSEEWKLVGFLASAEGRELRNAEDGQVLVTLHKLVHRWMQEKRFNLVPLGPYLTLGSDLAKELYRFIETQRGFGANGDYSITVTPELLATLGCRDTAMRRVRMKLRRACQEIMEVDRRYLAAGLRRNAKKDYVLFFERQVVVQEPPVLPRVGVSDQAAATR